MLNLNLEDDVRSYIETADQNGGNKRNSHGKAFENCIKDYLVEAYGFIPISYKYYINNQNNLKNLRYIIKQPVSPIRSVFDRDHKVDLLLIAKNANRTKEFPKKNLKIYFELCFQDITGTVYPKMEGQLYRLFGIDSIMLCGGSIFKKELSFYNYQRMINNRNNTNSITRIMQTDLFEDWADRAFG